MIRTLEECRTLAVSTAPIGAEIWFGILPAVLPQANFRCASSAEKQMSTEPNADDWLMAGKVLYWLQQGVKRRNKGKSPPKVFGATQRMALDALIAISSRRYNVTVVTENYDDFNAINYYCKFKLMKGSEFLERFEEKLK